MLEVIELKICSGHFDIVYIQRHTNKLGQTMKIMSKNERHNYMMIYARNKNIGDL